MEDDKKLLDGIISDYYNSIEDLFLFRVKNDWKIDASFSFFMISSMFLLFNIVPIIPSFVDDYFLSLFNFIKNNLKLPFQEYNFWIKWSLGIMVSIIFFVFSYLLNKYWDKKDLKKALNKQFMSFGYAFTLRKELKSYLINDNEIHLEHTLPYFQKIISSITIAPFHLGKEENRAEISLDILSKTLTNEFTWLEFTSESNKIIESLSTVHPKLERRLKQKIELEKVLPFIDILVLIEFSKIKPNTLTPQGNELKEQRNSYVKAFADKLNEIKILEDLTEYSNVKKNRVKSIITPITNLFSSSNILTMFFSWLILLTLVFVLSSILVINSLNLIIDSTILIGLLTAPFLGAITLVATIYSKKKN